MDKFLKGNYEIKNFKNEEGKDKETNSSEVFETKALEKLGGSIAFVMKSNKFVWDEEDAE